jgi:hypothetical protein
VIYNYQSCPGSVNRFKQRLYEKYRIEKPGYGSDESPPDSDGLSAVIQISEVVGHTNCGYRELCIATGIMIINTGLPAQLGIDITFY